MTVVFQIQNLTKIYGKQRKAANQDITLSIEEGEIFGLLGPNGAGKSTLVNQLAGLVRPTSGSIHLYKFDVIANPSICAEYIALQPQHSTALGSLFPEEALYYTARLRGVIPREARDQVTSLMEEFGLNVLRRRQIRQLSGGQQKLVKLALTFIGNRPIQIFDEPTNDLDPIVRRRIWEKILERNRGGTTILLVTHNVAEAERVIQRVGIIDSGSLLALGSPGELKAGIDQRVRLELQFRQNGDMYLPILASLGDVKMLTRQHYVVHCTRADSQQAINTVMGKIGIDNLDDFRILTPSLEDVYLQLGGETKIGG